MALTLAERLRRFPPMMCFLLARHGHNRHVVHLSVREIAERSGMAIEEVAELSWALDWDQVPVRALMAFPRACGVSLDDRHNIDVHFRFMVAQAAKGWPYLKADLRQYQRELAPRIEAYQEHLLKLRKAERETLSK